MKLKKIPRNINSIRSFEVIDNKKREVITFLSGILIKTKNWNIRLSKSTFDFRDRVFLSIKTYKSLNKVFYICLADNIIITLSEDEIDYFIKPNIRNKK